MADTRGQRARARAQASSTPSLASSMSPVASSNVVTILRCSRSYQSSKLSKWVPLARRRLVDALMTITSHDRRKMLGWLARPPGAVDLGPLRQLRSAAETIAAAGTLALAGGCSSGASSPAGKSAVPVARAAAEADCRHLAAAACYTPQQLRGRGVPDVAADADPATDNAGRQRKGR